MFSSSRTLPGQLCAVSASSAAGVSSTVRPARARRSAETARRASGLDYSILPRRTRTIVLRAAAFIAAAILAAAVPARAQLVDTLKFHTSFPFLIGKTTMPAGAYTITPMQGDNSLRRLSNGQSSVLVFTENDSPRHPPKNDEVTFTRQGDGTC